MALAGEFAVWGIGIGVVIACFGEVGQQMLVEQDEQIVDHVVGEFSCSSSMGEGILVSAIILYLLAHFRKQNADLELYPRC